MAGQNPRFGGGALRARRTWRARRSFAGRERGQATVEAAVLIPVLFTALLLLLQPGILLYDRMVMQGAAAEGCRLLATKTAAQGDMDGSCEAFVRHRLGAVPRTTASTCTAEAAAGTSCWRATKDPRR